MVDENHAVCVETVRVRNMLRNRRMSPSIQYASWNQLVSMIEYKSGWYGKRFVKFDPWIASMQTCSSCGSRSGPNTLSTGVWTCSQCVTVYDRDINASVNIKHEGIKQLKAAGVSVSACGGLHQTGDLPAAAQEAGSSFLQVGEQSS